MGTSGRRARSPNAIDLDLLVPIDAVETDPASHQGGKHRVDAMRMLMTTTVDVPSLRRFVQSHPDLAVELERVLAAPPPRGCLG